MHEGGNGPSLYSTLRSTSLRLLVFPYISMSDGSPKDYGIELAGGAIEVAGLLVNPKIVEIIRKNFSGDGRGSAVISIWINHANCF